MPKAPTRCLGRIASLPDPRTLRLANYFNPTLAPFPAERLWHAVVPDWGMMGNNQYGNCVIVTTAHMLLNWRANSVKDLNRITDTAVIDLSREMGALNGYQIIDRLKWWRNKRMFGDRLWAFAKCTTTDADMVKAVTNEFGGIDIGLQLPLAWQTATLWDTGTGPAYEPASWGLHSVPIVGYDATAAFCVTWGRVQPITFRALATYCDEAYALLDPSWILQDGIAPCGLDLPALHADLCELGGPQLPSYAFSNPPLQRP